MPSPEPVPVRPRPRRGAPEPTPNGTNGHTTPDELRRLTRAVEEIHAAAVELKLAPLRLEWQEPDAAIEVDPNKAAAQRYVESLLGDYEGLRAGPIALPLAAIPTPAEPHSYLVGNLIRPGTTVMLAGPPGAAKSWASRQLALSCGAGLSIFLDRYEIARPLNVLVIDEDNGPDEEWRRDETLMAHLSLQRAQVTTVRRVSLEGVQLEHESWQRWLRGQIRLHDLDLIVLDPISEMHGGKELREDPAFRSMIAFLKRLKVDFPRLATIVVHHTRKRDPRTAGAPATLEDVRGQWGQTPDVVVLMSPMADRRVRWEVHKRVPHSALILEQIAQGLNGEGGLKTVADADSAPNQRMQTDARVLGAIDAGATTPEEIRVGTGLSQSAVYKAVKRLSGAGLITGKAPLERRDEPLEETA